MTQLRHAHPEAVRLATASQLMLESWQVGPYCWLITSDNDQSNCHSEAEFNAFIAHYME
jgi:hypothetical protein